MPDHHCALLRAASNMLTMSSTVADCFIRSRAEKSRSTLFPSSKNNATIIWILV